MTNSAMLILGVKVGLTAFGSVMGVLMILYVMVRILQKFDSEKKHS